MSRAILFWGCCLGVLFLWAVGGGERAAAGDEPETLVLDQLVDLYEPVTFDHMMHADIYSCYRCHHHTTSAGTEDEICGRCHSQSAELQSITCDGCHLARTAPEEREVKNELFHIDKPSLKGALHLLCLNCHEVDGGPTGCLECHDYTEKGRERFRINE